MKQRLQVPALVSKYWLPLALLVLWWYASSGSQSLYFPPLSEICGVAWRDLTSGPLVGYLGFSLTNLVFGLAIAITTGVVFGVLLGSLPRVLSAVDPYIQFMRSIPQVALVPLIIGALGIGAVPKIWSIGFACMWPILLSTIDGVRGVDPSQIDFARAYRLPKIARYLDVIVPAAMPQIIPGVRIALAIGVIVMVVSELYGADSGIGYYILQSGRNFAVRETWAGTILVGLIGYALSRLFEVFEHIALRWYFESSAQSQRG